MTLKNVCRDVDELILKTDRLYEVIQNRFPEMERSIDMSGEETRLLLNYFIRTRDENGEGRGKDFRIMQILSDIKTNIEEVDQSLLRREEIDELLKAFVGNDRTDEVSFSRLHEIVQIISQALTDIDLISLNAIIFASHLGEEGAPFSVVAGSIKSMSMGVVQSNIDVRVLIDSLQDWLEGFQVNIADLIEFRDRITSEHAEEVKDKFNMITESLGEVGSQLYDLLQNVAGIIEPGRELMTLTQNQDIIRQGLEHLSYIMKEIEKIGEQEDRDSETNEEKEVMERMSRRLALVGYAERLVSSIEYQLQISSSDIVNKLETLNKQLIGICEDSHLLSEFFGGSLQPEVDDRGVVDYNFQEMKDFISSFMKVIGEFSDRCRQLTSDRQDFVGRLKKTRRNIDWISGQLHNLKRLRLMSAIELARLGMKDHAFNREIDGISKRVMAAISENRDYFQELTIILGANLSKLDSTMSESQDNIHTAVNVMEKTLEELKTTNDIINRAIHSLNTELNTLSMGINNLKDDFSMAEKFDSIISIIGSDINAIKNTINDDMLYFTNLFKIKKVPESYDHIEEKTKRFVDYIEEISGKTGLRSHQLSNDEADNLVLF